MLLNFFGNGFFVDLVDSSGPRGSHTNPVLVDPKKTGNYLTQSMPLTLPQQTLMADLIKTTPTPIELFQKVQIQIQGHKLILRRI